MKKYTVKQLADLAKISVRTLHYYDQIELLKPHEKSQKGYRYYDQDDLLRLQQIMFFKELGINLVEIQKILDDPQFDLKKALKSHRDEITKRLKQFKQLLITIDKTIYNLNQKTMLSDQDMYQGFTPEQVKANREEVTRRWGAKALQNSENRIRKMSKQQWNAVKEEGENICKKLASLMVGPPANGDPADPEVQKCIVAWAKYLGNFHTVTEGYLRGLGNMYVEDARFTAYYERFGKGLANFKNQAIQIYCDNGMKVLE